MYKYFFKVFYNKINKKEYNLQIWQYNIYYTNIIIIKDVIILEKTKKKEKLSIDIADITTLVKMAQVLSLVNFARKYIWSINNTNIDVTKKLRLTDIKKYKKYINQIEKKVD